jgi:ribonuclease P/MRP protein subunit POP5
MVRFKHRYLLVHLIFPNSLDNPLSPSSSSSGAERPLPPTLNEAGLISLLRESLSVNFGDVGAGEVGGTFTSESSRLLCWSNRMARLAMVAGERR